MNGPAAANELANRWSGRATLSDQAWPAAEWQELCAAGATRWTIPGAYGGDDLPAPALLEACWHLARGALLPTFVLSQFQAACQRLRIAGSEELRQRWLPGLADGSLFATVGISHLTTSRQHVQPVVQAVAAGDGFRLTGDVPWVTGAGRADVIVAGGTLADGRQILAAIPTQRAGVAVGPALHLLALTGSETGSIVLTDVEIQPEEVIAGPIERVVQQSAAGGAGSLMTSTLAAGHASGCVEQLNREFAHQPALGSLVAALSAEAQALRRDIMRAATHPTDPLATPEHLRARATELALRSSQALLTATKGAGFATGHVAERLAREALFFLVWSCPQAVATRLLNNFSGCEL